MKPTLALHQATACRDTACFIWPFARDTHGRGQIFLEGKRRQVHVLVCEAVNGPRPTPKHEVSHSCHNGRGGCVNGRHLSWATRAENIRLWPHMRRGRKLTEEQVEEIRAWATLIKTKTWIARRYGVSLRMVSQIINGERWWWLT